MIMLWICIVIGIVVFGAMAYAMFRFRRSKGAVPDTNFTHSTVLEALWTVIPIVILVGSAIPATRMVVAQYNADHDAKPAEMTIKVTGYQWMWRYQYIDQGVEFISRLDRESDRLRQTGTPAGRARRAQDACATSTVRGAAGQHSHPLRVPADDVIHAGCAGAGWKQAPPRINEPGPVATPAPTAGLRRRAKDHASCRAWSSVPRPLPAGLRREGRTPAVA